MELHADKAHLALVQLQKRHRIATSVLVWVAKGQVQREGGRPGYEISRKVMQGKALSLLEEMAKPPQIAEPPVSR